MIEIIACSGSIMRKEELIILKYRSDIHHIFWIIRFIPV